MSDLAIHFHLPVFNFGLFVISDSTNSEPRVERGEGCAREYTLVEEALSLIVSVSRIFSLFLPHWFSKNDSPFVSNLPKCRSIS